MVLLSCIVTNLLLSFIAYMGTLLTSPVSCLLTDPGSCPGGIVSNVTGGLAQQWLYNTNVGMNIAPTLNRVPKVPAVPLTNSINMYIHTLYTHTHTQGG
jgi:hypothetical protein